MRNVIIYMTPVPECWGNLKHFCDAHELSYNTYSKKKFPIKINGYLLHRTKILTGTLVPEAGGQKTF